MLLLRETGRGGCRLTVQPGANEIPCTLARQKAGELSQRDATGRGGDCGEIKPAPCLSGSRASSPRKQPQGWEGCFSTWVFTRVCAQSLQACLTLCNPVDYSPPGSSVHRILQARILECQPGSSVHRILQARILEWVAMPSARGSSQPRNQTFISCDSCIAGRFFTAEPPGKPPCGLIHVKIH